MKIEIIIHIKCFNMNIFNGNIENIIHYKILNEGIILCVDMKLKSKSTKYLKV